MTATAGGGFDKRIIQPRGLRPYRKDQMAKGIIKTNSNYSKVNSIEMPITLQR